MDYKGFGPLKQEVFNSGNRSSGYVCGGATLRYGVSQPHRVAPERVLGEVGRRCNIIALVAGSFHLKHNLF